MIRDSTALTQPTTHLYAQGFTTGPDPRGYLLLGARLAIVSKGWESRGGLGRCTQTTAASPRLCRCLRRSRFPVSTTGRKPSMTSRTRAASPYSLARSTGSSFHRPPNLRTDTSAIYAWGQSAGQFLSNYFARQGIINLEVDREEYTGEIFPITRPGMGRPIIMLRIHRRTKAARRAGLWA